MSYKVVKKITFQLTTPDGEKTLTREELENILKQAKQKLQEQQKFISDVELVLEIPILASKSIAKRNYILATEDVNKVYACLSDTPKDLEELGKEAGFGYSKTRIALKTLEASSLVRKAVHLNNKFLFTKRPVLVHDNKSSPTERIYAEEMPDFSSLVKAQKRNGELRRQS